MSSRVSRSSSSSDSRTDHAACRRAARSRCARSMPTRRGSHSRSAGSDVSSIISVADSSPASGMSWLYVSTSCAICSSRSMRSARAISCTCQRIVTVFSNTIVMIGPSAIRRDFFRSMMLPAQLVAFAFVRAHVDDVVDGQLPHSLLLQSVRAGQHLQRVDRPLPAALFDRDVRELAVAGDELRVGIADLLHQRLGDAPGQLRRSRRAVPTCRRWRCSARPSAPWPR